MGDGGMRLFDWFFADSETSRSPESMDPDIREEASRMVGAIVGGRHLYDNAHGWNGEHPLHVPFFILTHHPPEVTGEVNGRFITDGVESAIKQARSAAGDKVVAVASPNIARQCLEAGLLDEISLHIVPVLLGGGVRLFDLQGSAPVELVCTQTNNVKKVVHMNFQVVKMDQQENDLPRELASPALRALQGAGITQLEQLTQISEAEVKQLHGIGPGALAQLRRALETRGLSFANGK
jgi:dihydrofolate reductase